MDYDSEYDSEYDILETKDQYEIINYKRTQLRLHQLCCFGEKTQYPDRMKTCESIGHTIMSKLGLPPTSLDAVIKLINDKSKLDLFETLNYNILTPKNADNYVSDHDAVRIRLKTILHPYMKKQLTFNLVSFNLEGLCRKNEQDPMFSDRLNKLQDIIKSSVSHGFIMLCQEVVLQLSDKKTQLELLEKNGEKIREILSNDKVNLKFKSDEYTSGVFYDSNVWKLEKTIEIKRRMSDKRSNAYLLSSEFGKLWLVNIHLKAKKRANIPSRSLEARSTNLLDLSSLASYIGIKKSDIGFESSDVTHTEELLNIINKVNEHNANLNVPVYLCGDYNTITDKEDLFRMTTEELI